MPPNALYIAFSPDDGLAAVSSFGTTVSIFQVCDGTWTTSAVQTISYPTAPQGVAFSCDDFAAVSLFGDGTNPGSVQAYQVEELSCP